MSRPRCRRGRCRGWRTLALPLMPVALPFRISLLLRLDARMGLFGSASWFDGLATAGWNLPVPAAAEPQALPMMRPHIAMIVVMVRSYLPFMALPLYASLERLDPALDEAAMDLGARPWQVLRDVTLPLRVWPKVRGSRPRSTRWPR